MLSRNWPWTKGDDERLRAFVTQGASVIRAAAALRRTTIEVRARAREVGCPFPILRTERSRPMKFTADRPYGDPEAAARKLVEIANSVEAAQDGRIFIESVNGSFLYEHKGSPDEYKAALDLAIQRGWLVLHGSGAYVTFMQAGAELF